MSFIYLDHNSTTPIDPEVVDAMAQCYRAGYANPASQHQAGRRARKALEAAREGIARILGADTSGVAGDPVIFTSGGTESNNLALRGLAGRAPGRIVISAIEHPSVVAAADELARQGFEIARVRVSSAGVVDLDQLRQLVDERTRLVSIMLGNNETGVLQPVAAAAGICNSAGVPLHTDAVQVVGKLPVDFRKLGVAAMSFAAHKFHGPRAIGGLVVRHDVHIEPILFGGFQQAAVRPGTESVALAVGMQRALEIWSGDARPRAARMAQLRDRLEQRLQALLDKIIVNGARAERLPHTSNISFPGLDRQAILMALDLAGVACSTGSTCASGSSEPSPVLLAMGCPKAVVESSIRISLGAATTSPEVEDAAGRIINTINHLRHQKEAANRASASGPANAKTL